MPIAEASLRTRDTGRQSGRLRSLLVSALHTAAQLTSPKCPRCGARGPAVSTQPVEHEQSYCYEVACRACGHGWTVVAADPLLGP